MRNQGIMIILIRMSTLLSLSTFLLFVITSPATAKLGGVLVHQKISDTEGGFFDQLDNSDNFGVSASSLGDLDGDGVTDLAVGANFDDDGGNDNGAVWILFLNTDGTVKEHQKISDWFGGFTGILQADFFGYSVAALGDLDGDGVSDLAVGAPSDNDGGIDHGAVWILFLHSNGKVKAHQKISDTEGGFTGTLHFNDFFGDALTCLGDLDGDGVIDLGVGASRSSGISGRGAVWILFLNNDGTVKAQQKINDTHGNFTGILENEDSFGCSLASLGDLDGDGVTDLAVGAKSDDDGGDDNGAVWMLFLNGNGTVKTHQKISKSEGGFTGTLDDDAHFGSSLVSMPDLDGDGVIELTVGAERDGWGRGAVWNLFMNSEGTVKSHQKISQLHGCFNGFLYISGRFGSSVAYLDDLNGDGIGDLAVGNLNDNDGGHHRGAVWNLFLNNDSLITAELACNPYSGTLPFVVHFDIMLGNNSTEFERWVDAKLGIHTAGGLSIPNWKTGTLHFTPGDSIHPVFNQVIPDLPTAYGSNIFTLRAIDITPPPYNMPPYPAACDSVIDFCTVTGIMP